MDRIAVVGGDGIGPEGIGCTVDVLAEAQRSASGFELDSLAARDGAGRNSRPATPFPPRRRRPAARPMRSCSAPAG